MRISGIWRNKCVNKTVWREILAVTFFGGEYWAKTSTSTHQHQQVHHVTSSSKPQYEVDDESSGEEDDLLEAIADWQQN